MKKILLMMLVAFSVITLAACNSGTTTPSEKKGDVNIKALTATVSKPAEVSAEIKAQSKFVRLADGDEIEPTTTVEVEHAQYIIMYKSEKDIKFTIELDNPKGQSIDAVELKCDDPNATILVSGEWEKLSSKDGYVVNWASENAYRKTYYLQTISQDSINTLTVSDIKVNGEWQNAALDNDQLKIYKMDDEDLKWDFVSNTPSGYKWKFDCSEKISNLVVKVGNDVLTADENGVYTVEYDCRVSWTWDYATGDVSGNGTEVVNHWDNEREIKIFKLMYASEYANQPQVAILMSYQQVTVFIQFLGTDIDTTNIIANVLERSYTLLPGINGIKCYEIWATLTTKDINDLILVIGGIRFVSNDGGKTLEIIDNN